tara:strand:- start:3200 stop:3919 length:720 start_codon:yes stop_codon:yes gene_type:complete
MKMNVLEIKKINCEAWGVIFSRKINVEIASENLIIATDFLNKQIENRYCIFFGTLLGFIREGNFMVHDEDTDIALINPSSFFLRNLKKKLIESGFYIFRDDTFILSGMRKGEYIDFHKFYKFYDKYQSDCFIFKEETFDKLKDLKLTNVVSTKVPFNSEEILESMYGKTWRKPIENHHVDPLSKFKNNRLNFKFNLVLYKLYTKISKSNSLLGSFVRSKFFRYFINIYNKLFDFIIKKS